MASAKRKRAKPAKGDRINLDDHPDYHILLGEVVMSNGKQLSECTHADMAKFTMADREFLIAEGHRRKLPMPWPDPWPGPWKQLGAVVLSDGKLLRQWTNDDLRFLTEADTALLKAEAKRLGLPTTPT